jgi:hypothetical protein
MQELYYTWNGIDPINWNYISQFHLNPPLKYEYMCRSAETQEEYEKHKKYLSLSNISIKDYILSKYFTTFHIIQQGWTIVCNNFPLNLESDVMQLLLWIHPNKLFSETDVITIINAWMCDHEYKEYIFYKNIPALRSVPALEHYHIFVHLLV